MTKFLTVYKNGIPWPSEFKSSANQNGGRISLRYFGTENWAPPTAPQLNCQTSCFRAAASTTARWAPPPWRTLFSSVIFTLEERWAKFAQLFTFYWDLTRNKFSFPLSFFVTRSPLFIWTLGWRHLGIWKKSIRRSPGVPVKLGGTEWRPRMDRRPPGVEASAISPTFE